MDACKEMDEKRYVALLTKLIVGQICSRNAIDPGLDPRSHCADYVVVPTVLVDQGDIVLGRTKRSLAAVSSL